MLPSVITISNAYGTTEGVILFYFKNFIFDDFWILHCLSVESDDEYYYDDGITEEEEQLSNEQSTGNDLVGSSSSSTPRETEDPLVTLRAQNAAVLEEIRMIESTVRDPVERFKKMRDLAAKHREIVYNLKKEENHVSGDQAAAAAAATTTTTTTTTTPSKIDADRLEW